MTQTPRMRPEFDVPLPGDGEAVIARFQKIFESEGVELEGQVRGHHAFVRLPSDKRTLLSPHLELELREGPTHPVLHGRFSPQPNVWTGFMALFFLLGMLGLSGLVFGLAQMMIGGPIWMMWSAPASLALIAFIYGAAFIGQGLSSDEMFVLRAFVESVVREVGNDSVAS